MVTMTTEGIPKPARVVSLLEPDSEGFSIEEYLRQFDVSLDRGFLRDRDPVRCFPSTPKYEAHRQWESVAASCSKLRAAGKLREVALKLPPFDVNILDPSEYEYAMLVLSIIGNGFIHGTAMGQKPVDRLPNLIAQPWYDVAQLVGHPPIITHSSIVIANWYVINSNNNAGHRASNDEIRLGNICTLHSFTGGADEDWFYLVTVDIEARAAPGVAAAVEIIRNVLLDANHSREAQVSDGFKRVALALEAMSATMSRMKEQNDPYIFYNRVRQCLAGWKNNPDFPNGVTYEGVASGKDVQLFCTGGSAAQSTTLHVFDELLGIRHASPFLQEARDYMPAKHRQFVNELRVLCHDGDSTAANGGNNSGIGNNRIREYVLSSTNTELREAYNDCVAKLEQFRSKHIQIVAQYIIAQSKDLNREQGTGGSNLIPFLKGIRDVVKESVLRE